MNGTIFLQQNHQTLNMSVGFCEFRIEFNKTLHLIAAIAEDKYWNPYVNMAHVKTAIQIFKYSVTEMWNLFIFDWSLLWL